MKDTLFVNLEIPIMYKNGRIRFDKNDEKLQFLEKYEQENECNILHPRKKNDTNIVTFSVNFYINTNKMKFCSLFMHIFACVDREIEHGR